MPAEQINKAKKCTFMQTEVAFLGHIVCRTGLECNPEKLSAVRNWHEPNRVKALNHPRFLEWLGAPESAWLLEMSPGQWCDTLSRDQAMTAAMRLHRDTCLMKTNLDILDQYTLALHGTASKILQKTIGGGPYPRAEVAAAAQGPRARRASVHMEALGLWRLWVQFKTSQVKTSIRDVFNGL